MKYFLAKTEPLEYSIDDLKKDGSGPWTGVNNPQAKSFLRSMKKGDLVYIYHTGGVKMIVGQAEVTKEGEVPVFKFKKKFESPIASLSEIKAIPEFSDLRLVRQSRLSVMELPEKFVTWLLKKEKDQ